MSETLENDMKLWTYMSIMAALLFIGPAISLIEDYYNEHIYQKFKQQYSWLDKEIYYIVKTESNKYKIDKNIIFAIINSESRGNRYAVSIAGALGLMQVMPYHVTERKEVLFDATKNIKTGVRVLNEFMIKNNGNLIKAINAYERGNKRQDVNVKYLSEIVQNIYYEE
jgi:soluble lytic murein transglycosylase-like protein